MLSRICNFSVVAAIGWLLLSSCNKEIHPSGSLLDDTQWRLQAYINMLNGEKNVISYKDAVFLNFLKNGKYCYTAGNRNLSASYSLNSQNKKATFFKSSHELTLHDNLDAVYKTTLLATGIELTGSTLKIIDTKSSRFLIFERIR